MWRILSAKDLEVFCATARLSAGYEITNIAAEGDGIEQKHIQLPEFILP